MSKLTRLPVIVRAAAGRGRLRVQGVAVLADDGLVVSLLGGDRSHVGAVGVGVPRQSLAEPSRRSATSSVITVLGHREDELAKSVAEELARRLGQVTVVVAGMHIEGPAAGELGTLAANARKVAEKLADVLSTRPAGEPGMGQGDAFQAERGHG